MPVAMAPPNRYTNSSISRTGRTSEVISASRLRRLSRTHRAVMTGTLARAGEGRAAVGLGTGMTASDTGGLLLAGLAVGAGSAAARELGRTAGQGQEHVVEGGAAHAELVNRDTARV